MKKILSIIFILLMCSITLAGTLTSNHNYYKPDYGEAGSIWWSQINNNFDMLDKNSVYTLSGDYGSSLENMVAIVNQPRTVFVDVPNTVTSTITIPAHINLIWLAGATSTLNTGVVLNMNGKLEAGLYTLFSYTAGLATTTFGAGAVEAVYPEWFESSQGNLNLQNICSMLGSSNSATIIIPEAYTLTASATTTSNIILEFTNAGKITLGAYNLTINGHVIAPLRQVINRNSTGTVTFGAGAVEAVYPEWWGTVAGSTANQSTNATALQNMLNMFVAMSQAGIRPLPSIRLTGKYYYSGSGLTIATASGEDVTGLTIEGISGGAWEANGGVEDRWSGLHYTGTGIAFTAGASSDVAFVRSSIFRNWQLTGTASSTGGFLADEVHASLFKNFISAGFTATNAYGFKNTRGIGNIFFNVAFYGNYNGLSIGRNYNTFYKSRFVFNNNYGVLDVDSRKTTLNDCHIEGNTAGGIYINNTSSGGYFTLNDGWIENNGGYQIYLEGANGTTRHSYPSINNTTINTAAGGATAHIYLKWTDHARINPVWLNASIPQVEDVGTNTALWTNYLSNISGAQGSAGGFDSYGLNNGGGSPDRLYFASQAADIATKPGGCFVLPNSDADITDADHVSSITNEVQLSGVDISPGTTTLRIDTEGTGIITTPGDGPATRRVRININGTVYNLLAE